ncbi:hypothetical protein [Deinococcus marmoris]|uniref:Uncharacterized protein n=1 Tax=Deinococcus marmoris TaxID=249408 RepID=A0A1U7P4X4_9DEIO|nr:hypothetical protein [Deinococcus marmoris]OLV20208.1 hypothetical protein BOO71_0000652 [Deinococcus marmoris]
MTAPEALHSDTLALLVNEQRTRSAYRGLLQYADVERERSAAAQEAREEAEDWHNTPEHLTYIARLDAAQLALSEAQLDTLTAARRMAGSAPKEHRAELTEALAAHALQEVQQRPLRAAQRFQARRERLSPTLPALEISPAVVTHHQRQEHNLIARALVFPMPAPAHARSNPGENPDPLTQTLIESHSQMLSSLRLCARYTSAGQWTLAQHYAAQAEAGEREYLLAHARITRERRSTLRGRHYQDGDTFTLELPDGGGDHVFHLDLYWDDRGLGLTVDASEAGATERRTGIRVGGGWASLAAWVLDTHTRIVDEQGAGRRPDGDDDLVWRWTDDTHLRLKDGIQDRYPGLIAALEALRCSLTPI